MMNLLTKEKYVLTAFKEKLIRNRDLSKEDLIEMCNQFDDTIELASVALKIINRLHSNYSIMLSKQ
ncbi:MAG: hypothetical protein ACJA08_000661 [Cyclobacteriaceae bacterium]|jgi:hypothetical protein